jgi:hypothetical protein
LSRAPDVGERLWRIRKDSAFMDAQLRHGDGGGVDVHYFLDGAAVLSQHWPTREDALNDAAARLRDLQRAGWSTHW